MKTIYFIFDTELKETVGPYAYDDYQTADNQADRKRRSTGRAFTVKAKKLVMKSTPFHKMLLSYQSIVDSRKETNKIL